MKQDVNEETLLDLFKETEMRQDERETYESFISQCANAQTFLLLTDNCGEIVLDKLLLQQLRKRFPQLEITVMVRGDEAVNDATMEDAEYVDTLLIENLVPHQKNENTIDLKIRIDENNILAA